MNYEKFLISIILFSVILARGLDIGIEDSLRMIHPRKRARWLKMRGIEKDFSPIKPDSLNVRCVSRWSYGLPRRLMVKQPVIILIFSYQGEEESVF
ncbi:MAG: hypothetical protein N2323_01090 [candidate division WOR-3 bacterium]|nr:hypothetical protein [candidate division WOR-3 bacterium]MCX7836541.1 hypothetical protein [candidate division WOR-3 bacterium]MDW8113886.1 hypothetical protein [candidate division WOR-3 bacterium]